MSDKEPIPSLDTATLGQIVAELKRRSEAVLICGLRLPDSGDDEGEFYLWRAGGNTVLFGLLEQARQMMVAVNMGKPIETDGEGN